MTRSHHTSVLLAVAFNCLLLGAPARAVECNICGLTFNSTAPAVILLVGSDGGERTDPAGQFEVVIRDLANNPVPNATVRVVLNTDADVVLCPYQQAGLAVHAVSGDMWVEGRTDNAGRFVARLRGTALGPARVVTGGSTGCGIFVNGDLLVSPRVVAVDLDGSAGAGANDLSTWLADFGRGVNYARDDFDFDGSLSVNDLSVWLRLFGTGASAVGCGP